MTGKRYYITTLSAWQRHAARFITSHFIALDARSDSAGAPPFDSKGGESASDESVHILVLVEGDEGAHLALEDDAAFEALPHPLAQKPISQAARTALASHGIPYGATTFDVAETVSRVHPLLRHRVF